ncbi:MAG: hypothetical protein IPM66_20390 [Acidobacteriota bacterium]|nr:MAG: hypothetical protein IPM66_20390 [Acidobacteriota bacterium]
MKKTGFILVVALLAAAPAIGQEPAPSATEQKQSEATAREILAQVRRSLGGDENFRKIRSFSIEVKNRRRVRTGESVGDLKIEFLAPDKYQKTEKTSPRPAEILTLVQTINGSEVWFDRNLRRPTGMDDGSNEFMVRTPGRNSPITSGTAGMRTTTTTANSTIRNEMPGDRGQERTALGMRIPGPDGQERDNEIERLEQARINSANRQPATNKAPDLNVPDVKSAFEQQVRNESICLLSTLLAGDAAADQLRFSYIGEIDTENGKVHAIDIAGPHDFAGRLFIDKAGMHPVLFNYREYRYRNAGYLVSADGKPAADQARPEDVEIIAIQTFFSDYRKIDGIELPHQILRLINGVPFETWEIEKYKLNPNLKAKKFEK